MSISREGRLQAQELTYHDRPGPDVAQRVNSPGRQTPKNVCPQLWSVRIREPSLVDVIVSHSVFSCSYSPVNTPWCWQKQAAAPVACLSLPVTGHGARPEWPWPPSPGGHASAQRYLNSLSLLSQVLLAWEKQEPGLSLDRWPHREPCGRRTLEVVPSANQVRMAGFPESLQPKAFGHMAH